MKFVVLFLLFFIIFYVSPLEVGNIKIFIIFQVSLFFFLFFSILIRDKVKFDTISLSILLLILKIPLNPYIDSGLVSFITDLVKYSLIALFYLYSSFFHWEKIYNFNIILSTFILISVIPYLLNVINPIEEGYRLEMYGTESLGFIGFFQNPHAAAISISFVLLVIIFHLKQNFHKKNTFKKLVYLTLVLFGFIALYNTYVRTGYVIFIIGIIIIFYKSFKFKYIFYYTTFIVIIFSILVYIFKNDPILQSRVLDQSIYNEDIEFNKNKVGSGRFLFIETGLEIWNNLTYPEKILGIGTDELIFRMEYKLNIPITTHNGYLDMLLKNGLIGFILYLYFLGATYSKIKRMARNEYYLLVISIFYSYILYQFVQGGFFLFPELFLFSSVQLAYNNSKNFNHEQYSFK